MSYFDHRTPQQPHAPSFRVTPAAPPAYPVDEDGDRIYTEEDYGVPADGDAFLPDAEEEPILHAADPFAAPAAYPYAYEGTYDTLAADPGDDIWDEEDDLLPEDLTPEEQAELRRSNWRLLASLADFGAIILGTAVILVLIALLVSLMNWLINDVSQTFTLLQSPF